MDYGVLMKRYQVVGVSVLALVLIPLAATASTPAKHEPIKGSPPHIVSQAGQLTGRKHAKGVNRPVKVRVNIDGCDHNYGSRHVCVPVSLPVGENGCRYLTTHHFKLPLATNKDDKGLDPNHDGRACDLKDTFD
jgi:hypothetical protein